MKTCVADLEAMELSAYYMEADGAAYYDGLFLAKKEAGLVEASPLPKRERKSDVEIIREMEPERRHILMLCNLVNNYRAAKAGKRADGFMLDYCKLKGYMKLHHWGKGFILAEFGVSFGALTQLYFQCAKLTS